MTRNIRRALEGKGVSVDRREEEMRRLVCRLRSTASSSRAIKSSSSPHRAISGGFLVNSLLISCCIHAVVSLFHSLESGMQYLPNSSCCSTCVYAGGRCQIEPDSQSRGRRLGLASFRNTFGRALGAYVKRGVAPQVVRTLASQGLPWFFYTASAGDWAAVLCR